MTTKQTLRAFHFLTVNNQSFLAVYHTRCSGRSWHDASTLQSTDERLSSRHEVHALLRLALTAAHLQLVRQELHVALHVLLLHLRHVSGDVTVSRARSGKVSECGYLVHVLGLEHGRVPSVVEDEDVRLRQATAHFVEEILFLKTEDILH